MEIQEHIPDRNVLFNDIRYRLHEHRNSLDDDTILNVLRNLGHTTNTIKCIFPFPNDNDSNNLHDIDYWMIGTVSRSRSQFVFDRLGSSHALLSGAVAQQASLQPPAALWGCNASLRHPARSFCSLLSKEITKEQSYVSSNLYSVSTTNYDSNTSWFHKLFCCSLSLSLFKRSA